MTSIMNGPNILSRQILGKLLAFDPKVSEQLERARDLRKVVIEGMACQLLSS